MRRGEGEDDEGELPVGSARAHQQRDCHGHEVPINSAVSPAPSMISLKFVIQIRQSRLRNRGRSRAASLRCSVARTEGRQSKARTTSASIGRLLGMGRVLLRVLGTVLLASLFPAGLAFAQKRPLAVDDIY